MQSHPGPSTRRLALVDDNAEFRTLVRRLANPLDWEVHEFSNGKEFLAAVATDLAPALIMLDMVMPDMDGIETLHHLSATAVRCPIVLVTGRQPIYTRSAEELGRAYGLEMAAMLQKPVSVRELRAVLDPAQLNARP